MKIKGIIILIIISYLGLIDAFSQNKYYYSGGKKHELEIDSLNVVAKLKETANFENISNKSRNLKSIKKVIKIKGNKLVHFSLYSNADSSFLEDLKANFDDIEKVMYVHKLKNIPFIFTGEVLLQPKKDVSINKILNLIDNEAVIINETKYNTFKLEVKNWNKLLLVSNKIYESDLVSYCHPNFITEIVRYNNDPLYPDQYYLNNTGQLGGTLGVDINAPEAWAISEENATIRVAVIDDGVENHEDLDGRVLQGFTPTDSMGFGAPTNNLPPTDIYKIGHGQACAGIIAASHNDIGIAGISPSSLIVPVNIFNDWNEAHGKVIFSETVEDVARAIDWAWDEGAADVLSCSWGYMTAEIMSDEIVQAITRARTQGRNNLGSVVVFSSGNCSPYVNGVCFPANVNGVVAVGAISNSGSIWPYSSWGTELDLVVPSGDVNLNGNVRTTDRMGSYGYNNENYMTNFGGTSAACPQVAGAVALLLSTYPCISEPEVVNILRNTATDKGASGFDEVFGYGILNIFQAIQGILPSISGPSSVCASSNATFTVNNTQADASFFWTKSSNLTYISGQRTNSYTVNGSPGWVKVIITSSECNGNSYPLLKNFSDGSPDFGSAQINGLTQLTPGLSAVYSITPAQGATSYNWEIPLGCYNNYCWNIKTGQGTTLIDVQAGDLGLDVIKCTASNYCGTDSRFITINVQDPNSGGGGTDPCDPYMVISPNPNRGNNVVVTVIYPPDPCDETMMYIETGATVSILNNMGQTVYSKKHYGNNINIKGLNILPGLYHVKYTKNNKVLEKSMIVE